MGSTENLALSEKNITSNCSSQSAGCTRCKVFERTCDENCVFADVFSETEAHILLLLDDVYGVDQVENILCDIEPRLRKTAAATLVFEAEARKKDPVHGITGMVDKLSRQIELLEGDLKSLKQGGIGLGHDHPELIRTKIGEKVRI